MKRQTLRIRTLLGIGLLACSSLVHAGEPPNQMSVTTTVDGMDAFDQVCSLREAIHNASNNTQFSPVVNECLTGSASATDVIVLISGETYALSIPGGGSDEGDLDLFQNVSIGLDLRIETAGGEAPATIDQTVNGQRVMEIQSLGVELDNLVIRDGAIDGAGGGILNDNGNLLLTNVSLIGNSATAGGGIHNTGLIEIINGELQLNSASFIGGGAIFNSGPGDVRLRNTLVRANSAPSGGGIYNEGDYVEIALGSSVNLNQATSSDGGGVATLGEAYTWVGNSSFEGNMANGNGGAISHVSTLNLFLWDSTFSGNNAVEGGAVSVQSAGNLAVNRSVFRGNSSGSDGGAIRAGSLNCWDSVLEDNSAALGDGGAMWIALGGELDGCVLTGNTADEGGAIYAQILTIENSRIESNQSGTAGGGLYITNYGSLLTTRVIGNLTAGDGAGLHLDPNGLFSTSIERSQFTGNQAGGAGGGLWLGSEVSIGNSTIHNNAATDGGGMYIESGAEVTAVNMTLAGHLAGQDLHKFGKLTMGNSIIFTPGQPDCLTTLDDPPIYSLGNNVVDDDSCFFDQDLPSDQEIENPMLDALADNGGGTMTLALLDGSPLIDAGSNDLCGAAPVNGVDQRGAPRPAGAACDIGAHEQDAQPPATDGILMDGFENP